jgi:hypothetical protein
LLIEIGQPGLLMIAAQMLMFVPSAPLAQNPLLYAAFDYMLFCFFQTFSQKTNSFMKSNKRIAFTAFFLFP